MSYAEQDRGNMAVQILHDPSGAAELIVRLEAEQDRYKAALEELVDAVDQARARSWVDVESTQAFLRALKGARAALNQKEVPDA